MCPFESKKVQVHNGSFLRLFFITTLLISVTCLGAGVVEAAGLRNRKSAKTLRSMARIYMAYGDYKKAAPLAEEALMTAKSTFSGDAEIGSCYGDLAYLYRAMGQHNKAEHMCLTSIEYQKKAYFDMHPYVAMSLKTLSGIYMDQKKFVKAKIALDKAVEVMLDTHDKEEQSMAPFYVEYGKLYGLIGENSNAEKYFSKAMIMINDSYGPEHLYTATVLKSYADFKSQCGNYNKAMELAKKAVSIQEKVYGSDHHLLADTWVTLAGINHMQGNALQAGKLL